MMSFDSSLAGAGSGFGDPKRGAQLLVGLLFGGAAFAVAALILWQSAKRESEASEEASAEELPSQAVVSDSGGELSLKIDGSSICGISHLGKVRSSNQDSFRVLPLPELGADYALLLVCDGMGGHAGGEVASTIASNLIANVVAKLRSKEPEDMHECLRDALVRADAAIELRASKERGLEGMGTTAVAALIWRDGFVHAYIGDSRLYQLEKGEISYMTRDHSVVRLLIEEGVITEEQAKTNPYRSQLTSSLGGGKNSNRLTIEPKWSSAQEGPLRSWRPGSFLLLCSDGLNSELSSEEIKDVLLKNSNSCDAARQLINATLATAAKDNVTVIVAQRTP